MGGGKPAALPKGARQPGRTETEVPNHLWTELNGGLPPICGRSISDVSSLAPFWLIQLEYLSGRLLADQADDLGGIPLASLGFLFSCLLVNHSEQICRCIFDIEVSVLASPALRGENAAAMNIFKISAEKLVISLSLSSLYLSFTPKNHCPYSKKLFFSINSFSIFVEGWWSLHASLSSSDKLTLMDECLGMFICVLVQFHRHVVYLFTELRLGNRRRLPH